MGGQSCDSSHCLCCHARHPSAPADAAGFRRASLERSRASLERSRTWTSDMHSSKTTTAASSSSAMHSWHNSDPYSRRKGVVVNSTRVPATQPWQAQPSWDTRPDPVPAALVSLTSFQTPVHQGRRDLVCGIEFSDSGRLLATASVGKQVHVYNVQYRSDDWGDDGEGYVRQQWWSGSNGAVVQQDCLPFVSHRLPSKLSCLTWAPASEHLVSIGDYDGGIYQLDVHTGHFVTDMDEHSGRRILALAHARLLPSLTASASEDGTVKLWQATNAAHITITLPHAAAACSVDFSPADAHTLAIAAADTCAYLYDIRRADVPLRILQGHSRPASYVRFLGPDMLVTAAVDDSLALWDLNQAQCTPVQRFMGHANKRSFVGLSVCPSQKLLACGSESGRVYVYRTSWSQPVASAAVHSTVAPDEGSSSGRASPLDRALGSHQSLQDVAMAGLQLPVAAVPHSVGSAHSYRGAGQEFVSAVTWRPHVSEGMDGSDGPMLAAATSHGAVSVFGMVQCVG